jgi:YggT family protein
MPPYHRVRQVIDRIVNHFLQPIRRFIPTTGGLDFSPMVLIILLYILDSILTRLFLSL